MSEKVVIVGASPNPARYAFMAAELLSRYGHEFIPMGIKRGEVLGKPILDIRGLPKIEEVDTLTLYVRADLLAPWENYLVSLKPKRVIFNPGAENPNLEKLAQQAGVETIEACTLVMLRTGQF